MIVTHELQNDVSYMVIPCFTDEAYIDSHASQRNDAVEYRASGNGCRRLVVPEDDIEYSLSDADYFTHSFLDFSPK